jgi:hypothetical protein
MSQQLSFSFSDPDAGLHGLGRSGETAVVLSSSGASACGQVEVVQANDRFEIAVDGLIETVLEPLGAPVAFAKHERSDWLCRARGKAADGRALDGFGCVSLGAGGLGGLARRRSIWICFGDSLAFTLLAERASGKPGHDEPIAAFVARGTPLEASALADPLLSSTYRADPLTGSPNRGGQAGGQLLRAGLELWEEDDAETHERARALRISGETVAAGELAQGGVAASVAFLVWHHAGRQGAGAYISETAAG